MSNPKYSKYFKECPYDTLKSDRVCIIFGIDNVYIVNALTYILQPGPASAVRIDGALHELDHFDSSHTYEVISRELMGHAGCVMNEYPVVDVYRILYLFRIYDPCIQHAVKKLLMYGVRTGGKSPEQDIKEAADSLRRWQAMRREEREWTESQVP